MDFGSPISYNYEYPKDENCANRKDRYLFGSGFPVAPVMEAGARNRDVWLPAGCSRKDAGTGETDAAVSG